jgi:hypothetical protein
MGMVLPGNPLTCDFYLFECVESHFPIFSVAFAQFYIIGERIKITFTVLVDDNAAEVLNMGSDKLEDILILHLENGKDYFVSISGAYIPTCFAMPLEVLVRLPNPIRESATDISELYDNPMKGKPLLSVPKEIWRVVDYIFRFGLGVVSTPFFILLYSCSLHSSAFIF